MAITKTKGTEKITYATIEEAAKAAKKGKNVLTEIIKKGRLLDGWKYTEEVKPEVDKTDAKVKPELTFSTPDNNAYDGAKQGTSLMRDELGQWAEPSPAFVDLMNTPQYVAPKEPFFQKINTIPEDFHLTNIQKLINRRKKK